MKVIKITETEYQKILEIDKKNRNKRVDQKLRVLKLRYEGASNREISLRTGYNERYITKLIGDYAKQGFRNEAFTSLDKVIERLCDTIKNLPAAVISSITGRDRILNIY